MPVQTSTASDSTEPHLDLSVLSGCQSSLAVPFQSFPALSNDLLSCSPIKVGRTASPDSSFFLPGLDSSDAITSFLPSATASHVSSVPPFSVLTPLYIPGSRPRLSLAPGPLPF